MDYDIVKRLLDLTVAIILFIVLLPLMFLVSLAIVLCMGFPVLFRHTRPGQNAEPFELLKFRTMNETVDNSGTYLADEQRITAFGSLLRRFSLDELPQLINVITGDMSLVGPRPLLMEYLSRYTKEQARRHEVRPGITGWAQVNGRNAISWEEKFDYDLYYVEHYNFRFDVKIMLITILKVLKSEGISQVDHATSKPFMGSKK